MRGCLKNQISFVKLSSVGFSRAEVWASQVKKFYKKCKLNQFYLHVRQLVIWFYGPEAKLYKFGNIGLFGSNSKIEMTGAKVYKYGPSVQK